VKEFWKLVNFWRRYRQSQSGTFYWDTVYTDSGVPNEYLCSDRGKLLSVC